MKAAHGVVACSIFLVQSCSKEALQRTGYETLQNVQEQQCEKELSADCPERVRFEDYQQQRKESQSE